MFLRRLILCSALLVLNGCADSTFNQRDHELEYLGVVSSEEGCTTLGGDVTLDANIARVEDDQCTSPPTFARLCFINRGKQPLMSWGSVVTEYVRERDDGSYDVIQLGSLYDEALPDWISCFSSGAPQCSACEFP